MQILIPLMVRGHPLLLVVGAVLAAVIVAVGYVTTRSGTDGTWLC